MSAKQQMNALAERRRFLVLEAELHRSIICLECQGLRARLAPLGALRGQATDKSPLLLGGMALAGVLATRHWRKLIRWAPQLVTLWRVFGKRTRR